MVIVFGVGFFFSTVEMKETISYLILWGVKLLKSAQNLSWILGFVEIKKFVVHGVTVNECESKHS